MKTYTIRFSQCKRSSDEALEFWELQRIALSSRDFRQIVQALFDFSSKYDIRAEIREGSLDNVEAGRRIAVLVRWMDKETGDTMIRIARPREVYRTLRRSKQITA